LGTVLQFLGPRYLLSIEEAVCFELVDL